MSNAPDYHEYVSDETFLTKYNAYQKQFRTTARECDKVLIGLIAEAANARRSKGPARLLDVGCSTGNLLLHLHRMLPELSLTGGDLAESSLDECRRNPELSGVSFETIDLLTMPATGKWDIVVVNAVLYMMTDAQFETALDRLAGALASDGTLLVFDFFHPFDQELLIIEKSDSHPEGLPISFRPQRKISRWLQDHGFGNVQYRPFTLPIVLPKSDEPGLPTYTVKSADGINLPFRGTLFQPWCHMSAVKR
jgi:SAM-dependent methyltransferase